jgi:hypothetical protein
LLGLHVRGDPLLVVPIVLQLHVDLLFVAVIERDVRDLQPELAAGRRPRRRPRNVRRRNAARRAPRRRQRRSGNRAYSTPTTPRRPRS